MSYDRKTKRCSLVSGLLWLVLIGQWGKNVFQWARPAKSDGSGGNLHDRKSFWSSQINIFYSFFHFFDNFFHYFIFSEKFAPFQRGLFSSLHWNLDAFSAHVARQCAVFWGISVHINGLKKKKIEEVGKRGSFKGHWKRLFSGVNCDSGSLRSQLHDRKSFWSSQINSFYWFWIIFSRWFSEGKKTCRWRKWNVGMEIGRCWLAGGRGATRHAGKWIGGMLETSFS